MFKFKIEEGIPIAKRKRGGGAKYPFAAMKVGDSFFVPGARPHQLSGSVTGWRSRHGGQFVIRTVDGGVRVWRTA